MRFFFFFFFGGGGGGGAAEQAMSLRKIENTYWIKDD
jgi:hypothetical protein